MKKVALLLLSMIFALMLLSCQAVQPGGAGEGHVHTYEGQLQYNETAHFYRCTCGKAGTPEVHADINKDGVCDACGFGMDLIICEHQWVEYCDKPTTCALCGRWEWGSEPRGHEYDDEVTAPTCTEAGFTTHVCKHCGYTHVDTIVEALGHSPVVDDAVAPTCVNTGLTEGSHCSVCGEILTAQEVVDALGHDWTVATCKDPATCKVCGETTGEAIGHDTVSHEGKPATCLDNGYKAYETCSRCDYTTYEEIPALGHKPSDIVVENNVAPDCENDGSYDNVVYCTVCEKELSRATVTVDALGHKAGAAKVENNVAPDCENEGSYDNVVYCTVCEKELSRTTVTVDALGHKPGEIVVENNVDPDCENDGSYENVVYCTVCEKELSREAVTVDALGHKPGAEATCITAQTCTVCEAVLKDALGHAKVAHEAKAATCTAIGWEAYETCSRCDYSTYVEIPALGHAKVAHEAKAATCTAIGWEAYETCSRCDYSTYVEIPALGHAKVAHEAKAATCTAIGWEAYETCSRCDYSTYVEIPALGHAKVSHEAQAATCTAIGWEAYETCSRCDYSTYVEIPALGHSKVSHEAQAATCTAIGWEAYETCSRCDYSTYVEIPALGHAKVAHEAKAATCTAIGWEAYETCSRCDYSTYVEIPALDHDKVAHEAKAATCTAIGWEAYETCSRCDYSTYVEIPALGHDMADATCTKPSTCKRTGCNYTEGEALGHKDENADYKCDACSTKMLPAADSTLTIEQALAVATVAGTAYTTDKYYVTGIVTNVYNTQYGNMYLKDADGNEICLYGLYSSDGKTKYDAMDVKPVEGDELTVYGVLGMYNTTKQMKSGWLKNLTQHEHNYVEGKCSICGTTEPSEELITTIAGALAAGEGDAVELTGTVSGIYQAYNSQYGNISVYITDGIDQILAFRLVGEVKVGDKITVTGVITMYNEKPQIAQGCTFVMIEEHVCAFDPATCTAPATCPVCKATQGEVAEHTYVNGVCSVCDAKQPAGTTITASKTVKELITEYGWTSSTTKQSFTLDDNVSVKINGGSNTGKAYNGDHIRIYATDSPAGTITISVAEGYELVSIKISANTGTYAFLCLDGSTTDISNVLTNVSGTSVLLNSVKNGTNGKQVQVTALEVVYQAIVSAPECEHEGGEATCTAKAVCVICGEAYGSLAEHTWVDATCTAPKHCSVCKVTEGEALAHTFVDGACSVCGTADPSVGGEEEPVETTVTYTFSNYTAGTQYAIGENHEMDDILTVTTTQAHFTTQLRLYSSSSNNGYAIFESGKTIKSITFNMGYKKDTLNIYTSEDGETWTLKTTLTTTATTYKDYTAIELNSKYVKIDVAGSNQIRIASISVTYIG